MKQFMMFCAGISMLLLSASVFMFSIAPAKATYPHSTNATGKVMMDVNSIIYNGNLFFHILAWNSETGENILYNYNKATGQFNHSDYQLPDSPLD